MRHCHIMCVFSDVSYDERYLVNAYHQRNCYTCSSYRTQSANKYEGFQLLFSAFRLQYFWPLAHISRHSWQTERAEAERLQALADERKQEWEESHAAEESENTVSDTPVKAPVNINDYYGGNGQLILITAIRTFPSILLLKT